MLLLNKCPFCGEQPVVFRNANSNLTIQCCRCKSVTAKNLKEGFEKWNRLTISE